MKPPTATALVSPLLLAVLAFATTATAQPRPSEIPDYLGTWKLSATIQGNPSEFTLEVVERSGLVQAALGSAMSPEPSLIDQITKSDAGLDLAYTASYGGNSFRMHVKALAADGKLTGTLSDENGMFSAPFTGERAAEAAGIVEAALVGGGDSAAPAQTNQQQQQQQGRRRRFGSLQAQLALGDKNVKVSYGELKVGTPDRESFEKTADGAVFEYPGARVMKLFTDLDLAFGSTIVKTENLAPDYPGVYGLWLKKSGDGWKLVFNEEGDVWGTMHDPKKDVAEIPLEVAKLDTPKDQLEVTLAAEGEKTGVLRIVWGDTAWSAKFMTP
jgi:hypothetical protein